MEFSCCHEDFENFTNEELEELGRDISNNSRLTSLSLVESDGLNNEKLSSLFRGLTKSTSIKYVDLDSTTMVLAQWDL